MPQKLTSKDWPTRLLVLGYGGLLAAVAGFVNSVALLVLAFPVGNLTALTPSWAWIQPIRCCMRAA